MLSQPAGAHETASQPTSQSITPHRPTWSAQAGRQRRNDVGAGAGLGVETESLQPQVSQQRRLSRQRGMQQLSMGGSAACQRWR